jgi:hypothetical protein
MEAYSTAYYLSMTTDLRPILAVGLGVLATAGLLSLWATGRSPLGSALLVAILTVFGFRYVRLTTLPLAAATPWVLMGLTEVLRIATSALPAAMVAVASLGSVAAMGAIEAQNVGPLGFQWSRQPLKAVAWIAEHRPHALLFHGYNHGSALLYQGVPVAGVLIDPRAWMLYPEPFVHRYYEALADPEVFEQWANEAPFDTVMLTIGHHGSQILLDHMQRDPRWTIAYRDGSENIFVKVPPREK